MFERESLAHIGEKDDKGCDGCGTMTPAWGLYRTKEGDVCGRCLGATDKSPPTPVETRGWESDHGKYLKALRNAKLDETSWVFLPGCPYDDETVEAFRAYRDKLHRMTVDSMPDDWSWPESPTPKYKEN